MRNLKFFALLVVAIAGALVLALLYVLPPEQPREGRPAPKLSRPQRHQRSLPTAPPLPAPPFVPQAPAPVAREVAIVIDDIGYDMGRLEELLALDVPLTFAILPRLPHSAVAARAVHAAGREVLLHLPMEPRDPEQKPGEGALYVAMSDEELRRTVSDDFAAVPYAIGVNNHMGSRFMEEPEKLAIVFQQLKAHRLFFLDSRTTPLSQGQELAQRYHLGFAARQVFIDNGHSFQDTFTRLLATEGKGPVLMIGHPYPATIAALKEAIPIMKARGIRFVSASELVRTRMAMAREDSPVPSAP